MSINRVEVSGRLGKDPVLRGTAKGTPVLEMRVCVNDRVKTESGWQDKANWVDVTMFGARAESLSNILVKGSHVAVAGRLSQQSWVDKETGKGRSKLEVICDDIDFISGRAKGAPAEKEQESAEIYDEGIPF